MEFGIDPLPEENAVSIDLTSLVDVLFVLLLFFMVTTTFSDTSSISVNLPSASAQATETVKRDLAVRVTNAGELVNAEGDTKPKPITLEALSAELSRLSQSGTELTLVVRADTEAHHGVVVQVLDRAKQSGIQKIAIATELGAPR